MIESHQETTKPVISYKESLLNWWNFSHIKNSEQDILSMLPFYPESDGIRKAARIDVDIGNGNHIHEFCITNLISPLNLKLSLNEGEAENEGDGRDGRVHILLVHGYMAASSYFYKNYDQLSMIPGVEIHSIDLLGFGLSSRPKFPNYGCNSIEEILKTEDFFIDAIEQWRIKRGIKTFKVIAHSMGGYLMCSYAMKYNKSGDIISDMMLVSPMGTERNEFSLLHDNKYRYGQSGGDPFKEITEDQNDVKKHKKDTHFVTVKESSNDICGDSYLNEDERIHAPKFPKDKILRFLWNYHISPFQIIQYAGPLYSKILSSWSFRRFKSLPFREQLYLHYYSFSIFNQDICGELAITRLITPEILPRLPLIDRVIDGFSNAGGAKKIRTMWCYGENDWMNKFGGKDLVDELRENGYETSFKIIDHAGHHLYFDNPEEFNSLVVGFFNLKMAKN